MTKPLWMDDKIFGAERPRWTKRRKWRARMARADSARSVPDERGDVLAADRQGRGTISAEGV
jgi:hypothetical protein